MAVVDRWFDPMPADHPLVTDKDNSCPVCKKFFAEGDIVGLLPVQLAKAGKEYDNVVAIPIHRHCYLNEDDGK